MIAIDLFNAGQYTQAIELCEQQISNGQEPVKHQYIAGMACFNTGNFAKGAFLLGAAPDASSDMKNLKQMVQQSLNTQRRLPEIWFREETNYFADKTCLRIGGAVRMIDHAMGFAKQVIDLNATAERFGKDNHATLIADAHDLSALEDESVDFIASSHTIEHLVNPLLALKEWMRVLKPAGVMYAVVPHHLHTFDHKREITSLQHLVADLEKGRTDIDWFHICEFLRNHDCEKDFVFKGDREKHMTEFMKAPGLRTHYHVFDLPLVYAMHEYIGMRSTHCFEADISVHWTGIKPGKSEA